jgi:hypothetical protein
MATGRLLDGDPLPANTGIRNGARGKRASAPWCPVEVHIGHSVAKPEAERCGAFPLRPQRPASARRTSSAPSTTGERSEPTSPISISTISPGRSP